MSSCQLDIFQVPKGVRHKDQSFSNIRVYLSHNAKYCLNSQFFSIKMKNGHRKLMTIDSFILQVVLFSILSVGFESIFTGQ